MSKENGLSRPTEYFKPASVEKAVKLLAQYGEKGAAIAGKLKSKNRFSVVMMC